MNFSTKHVILLMFIVLAGYFVFFGQKGDVNQVILGEKEFLVEVARTEAEHRAGLSGRKPLSDDGGMLFIFENDEIHSFWMKDMLFSIDILWIDSNFRVVSMEKMVAPESYPKIFTPETKSLYVLEVLAGQADFLNVKIGDFIKIVKK